jgi:hypothetical protein
VSDNVTISYRGAHYELGRGNDFYGIWVAGAPRTQPSERWPDTPAGWHGAWTRFSAIEVPGTIVAVEPTGTRTFGVDRRSAVAVGLLAAGIVCGVIGLFPDYLAGSSLAQQPSEVVAHAIYFAVWATSALLIARGGARVRMGALLGLATSIVTFGLFFADAGTAIAGGAHLMGAGLILGLLGWLTCTAGCVMAFRLQPAGTLSRPGRHRIGLLVALILAALGAAASFAPSWDSFTLRTAAGTASSVTAGNAFSSPGPVIAGDVMAMLALVVVVVVAALWRPIHLGATLLAGAIIPMAAQAVAALVQLGQSVSPTQFGISSAEAARAGVTISSGVTPDFWIFFAFVVALAAICIGMLVPPGPAAVNTARSPLTTYS